MSAKVGFTSAGHLGHTLNGADMVQNLPTTTIPRASAPSITNTDSHRQSHSSSKLPSFRFADRKTSGSSTDTNNDESIDASAQNHSGINSADDPNGASGASTSSTSAVLSHPSLAHHAPPSPVSPNPSPGAGPVTSPIQLPSADTGPFPGPLAGPSTGSSTDPGPVAAVTGPLEAPDVVPALTLPATAQNLAHPTTHHHIEKQSASASAPASTSASPPSAATSTSIAAIAAVASPPLLQHRSRTSSSQPDSPVSVAEPTAPARRPASFPNTSPVQDVADLESPHSASVVARSRSRRSLTSRRSNVAASSSCPPPTLNSDRLQAVEAAQAVHWSSDRSSKDSSPPGQRELILPKALSNSNSLDDRRVSVSHRPPVSYRPPVNHNAQPSTSTPVRVPPIRAFRSSGSRKSLTLDMPTRPRAYDFGDDPLDSSYDRTLRALEGRVDQDFLLSATSGSGRRDTLDGDDTGDVFLKIAREESSRRRPDENLPDETQSVVESENASQSRRRPSITDNNSTPQARGPTFRTPTAHNHSKAYNSSPLVKSFDFPPQQQQQQPAAEASQVEGTESTTSNTAPSTVWDELDDLKSRIHRLELTGKLPSTSGAAVSRLSDERPPTANTTVTTMSSSPKRPGKDNQVIDTLSNTSIQKEAHPLLHAALTKSKHLLDVEVYRALESAANDAMALSTMMGSPGQLGPISSGASTIGSGTTMTDRQLRRKADSERRLNLLNGNPLPGPRTTTSTPSTPLESISQRRSSLMVARTRRAGTEEPEDGRRSSVMLRTRRAGTEEPEEGRRTSLLVRNRRGTMGEDDGDQPIFRSPSRAHTDLNTMRNVTQEQLSQPQASENSTLGSSALPRRRFASSNLNPSRLATPLTSNVPSPRRYLERSGQDRDGSNVTEKIPEERSQRHMSMGQSLLGRTSSMIRRPNRDSTVTITQSSAAAGGYR
ncbi:hypothetical protein AUP68_13173 [Ilyonectria robusta]